MYEIGTFRSTNNYNYTLTIIGINKKGILYFSASIHDGNLITKSIDAVNWRELKDFLRENEFQSYEVLKIKANYINLIKRLRKELYGGKPKKINPKGRVLIIWDRLSKGEALNVDDLLKEFNISRSMLARDLSTIRSVFENVVIRYNRMDRTYKLEGM